MMEIHGAITPLMDAELREQAELDIQTYDVLLHVFEADEGGIRMSSLARQVVISKSGLTTLVDRLEERGLLQRIPDPADRRAIRVILTENGDEAFRKAAAVHMASVERHFLDHLTDDEARIIATVLNRIVHDIGSTAEPS